MAQWNCWKIKGLPGSFWSQNCYHDIAARHILEIKWVWFSQHLFFPLTSSVVGLHSLFRSFYTWYALQQHPHEHTQFSDCHKSLPIESQDTSKSSYFPNVPSKALLVNVKHHLYSSTLFTPQCTDAGLLSKVPVQFPGFPLTSAGASSETIKHLLVFRHTEVLVGGG